MKKSTQRNQSKKVSKKLTKKQTGGGAFSKSKPTTFKNLHYKDSSYVNPELKCRY